MISDVLCEAISELNRYLEWECYHVNGQPDPEIVRLREHMRLILIDLNIPDGVSPEIDSDKAERMAKIKKKYNL